MQSPEELFRQRAWIAELSRELLVDPASADDLAQEAWLTLAGREHLGIRRPRAWARAILRNLQRAGRREEARRRVREEASARPEAVASTDALVQRAELQRILAQEVLALRDPYREAVLQHFFDGLSAAEIARRASIPAATVRSRLARGLAQLRTRLDSKLSRENWVPALAGLVRTIPSVPPAAPPPVPETSAPLHLFAGILAMKATLVGALLLAVAATASVAVLLSHDPGSAGPDGADPQAQADTPREVVRPTREVEGDSLVADTAAPITRESLGVARAENDPPTGQRTGQLILRTVTPEGQPLEGVRVTVESKAFSPQRAELSPSGAESDAAGNVILEHTDEGNSQTVRLSARHPDYSTAWIDAIWHVGEEVHLGDLVLQHAATLVGRVIDANGQPLEGIEVLASGLDNEGFDLEFARRRGPETPFPLPAARTLADGTFRLANVPVGQRRLWAGGQSFAWSWTEPVRLQRDGVFRIGDIELKDLRTDDSIGGRVLDPDGAPVANISISTMFFFADYGRSGSTTTDSEGHFEFVVEQRAPHDLTVFDPLGRYASIRVAGVEPGQTDLILQFQPPHPVTLLLVDEDGVPVEEATINARVAEGYDAISFVQSKLHPEGRALLIAPTEPFVLQVKARGFAPYVGPAFDPRDLGDEIAIELERLPGIGGLVLFPDGSAASGAEVFLRPVVQGDRVVQISGFRTLVGPNHSDRVQAGADGSFLLFPEGPGPYVVRAEAPNFAPTLSPVLQVDPNEYIGGLEIRLVHGGAIEGRVLTPPGVDPSGTIIGLSRGDGFARTLRVGTGGSYRFEGLTPGPWELTLRDEELDQASRTISYSFEPDAEPFEDWSCEVIDGRTTVFNLELGGFARTQLSGQLRMESVSGAGWTAKLADLSQTEIDPPTADSCALAADGSFLLETTRPGDYLLVLLAPEGPNGQLRLTETLTLEAGENNWDLMLNPGRIEGSGAHTSAGSEEPIFLTWNPGNRKRSLEGSLRLLPDAAGHFVLPLVPDGTLEFRTYAGTAQPGRTSAVLLSLQLAPGAIENVDLSQ